MKKYYLFILLFLFLFLPVGVDARREMSEIKNDYREGDHFSEHYYYTAWNCTESGCKGVGTNAYDCAGFVARVYRDYFGVDSSWGTQVTDVNGIYNLAPGDIVRFDEPKKGANTEVGHSVFVLGKNGSTITVAEANVGANHSIRWSSTYNVERFRIGFDHITKAWFPYGNPKKAPAINKTSNVTASFNSNTKKITANWDYVSPASDYRVKVYEKAKADKNNFTSPVYNKIVGTSTANTHYFDFKTPGEYAIGVTTILDDYSSKEAGYAYVSIVAPTSVSIDNLKDSVIYVGEQYRINTTILPENANINRSLTYESSNPDVLKISGTYVSAVGEGTATLTVTTENGKKASVTLTVKKLIPVESVTMSETNKEVWTGNTFQLKATINPSNANDQEIRWSSSNTKVATVDNNGKVTAISRGTAFIYATVGGKSGSCTVLVRTTGLALDFSQEVYVTTASNYYLKSNLSTNDGSSIDWNKVTFFVDGKEGTYNLTSNYIDFTSNYVGEVYTLYATYYGVTSSMKIKPVTAYSASSFDLLSSAGTEFTLLKNKKSVTDLYFEQKANYYPKTHLYVNKMDFDILYDPNVVAIYDLTTEYNEVNLYDDGKGKIHVSIDMGDDVFVLDQKNIIHITFIGAKDEDAESEVTFANVKTRVATKNYSFSTYDIDTKLTMHAKKYLPLRNAAIGNSLSKMEIRTTHQLEAIPVPNNTTDYYNTSWVSSNPNVVEVDSTGLLTAKSVGTATITMYMNSYSKRISVTVEDNTVYITNLTWDRDFSKLYNGRSYYIVPTLTPSNQTEASSVTLTSSNSNIVSVYNGAGYNYLTTKGEGTATITATAGTYQKTYTVTVLPKYVAVTNVSVSLNTDSVVVGKMAKATAVVTPTNASEPNITWSSNNTNVCSIDSNGSITAKSVGTCTITGRSNNSYSDSKKLTVVSDITSVSLDKSEFKIIKGTTDNKLTATIYPSNSIDKNIKWTSSNTNVVKVDQTGKLTIMGIGNATITVTGGNNKSATSNVVVVASTMKLTPNTLTLYVGDSSTITGTVTPDYADKSITWSTTDSNIAKVSNGKVTAVGVGACSISATNKYGVKATALVTVKAKQTIPVSSVSLDKTNLSLSVDDKATLNASILPNNATSKTVTWTSSNSSVAKVSNGVVTAVAPGYATITVKSNNGKTATCGVSVVAKRVNVSSISLNKTDVTLKVGNSDTITATINPSNATNRNIVWSSSNNNIVSVTNGKITAKSIGKATVTAMIGDVRSICNVTVIASDSASVYYHTHVESIGDQAYVSNGNMAGTAHQSKRLEAIRIYLANTGYTGSIEYRTHVQDYGWMDYVRDGEMSGTAHQSKRLEAIQIRLTGEVAEHYDIYYRVHAQNFGWMNWAKNDEMSGTASYSYRLEAIEIVLVSKGENPPMEGREFKTTKSFAKKTVGYSTHIQDYGWQEWRYDGKMAGTSHESKRLEAISIKLHNPTYSGSIQYRTHIQDIGWEKDWKVDGQDSGTHGQSKRLEAIQIQLTGEMAEHYDVYYRVHAQNFGWMGWAKNGEMAGTAHYAYRLEGIEIVVVPKGENPPSRDDTRTNQPFIDKNA